LPTRASSASSDVRLKHRTDIDGLRAVAVLPVVAFHLGFKQVHGGFAGVDVFFVISGFLIGSIILSEMTDRTFSVRTFYVRRLRRILPALFASLAVTSAVALWLLYPGELSQYAETLAAAVFSYSNVWFYQHAGYFDAPSASQPLLHTWSLAVEEQFYVALPLTLLLLRRLGRSPLRLALILIALASLALSIDGAFRAPDATFYLLPARAWELLLGTLAGMFAAPQSRALREAVAAAGLALIVGAVLLLDQRMPFPGLAAIPPCLGAAMVIWAGRAGPTATGAVLSWRPAVFVGLISYSLYLWHWPAIVLYKQFVVRDLTSLDRLLLFAAVFAVAVCSWWFVERPFRSGKMGPGVIFGLSGAAAAVLGVAALLTVNLGGFPQRFSPEVDRMAGYIEYRPPNDRRSGKSCFISDADAFADYDAAKCLHKTPGTPAVLVVGDSHAHHLIYGLMRALPAVQVLQANAAGCKPVIREQKWDTPRCRQLMNWLFNDYLAKEHVDLVVLAARWRMKDLTPLRETLRWARAHGVRTAVSGPIAEYHAKLPRLLAAEIARGPPGLARRRLVTELAQADRAVEALVLAEGDRYGSTYEALCGADDCQRVAADGAPVQFDYGHLTLEGSALVADSLVRQGLFADLASGSAPEP